jgi:hypothetical protein
MHKYHSNNEIVEILNELIKRNNNHIVIAENIASITGISEKISANVFGGTFSEMQDDIILGSDRSGNPFTSSMINVIPGDPQHACCPILLAVASGLRGPCSFGGILSRVVEHMDDCADITKVVLFYTDSWSESVFKSRFRREFVRAAEMGVCSFFSVCTNPISGPRLVEYNIP